MFKCIRRWARAWRAQKDERAYNEGYHWALTQILVEGASEGSVEAYAGGYRRDGSADPFDQGALQALRDLPGHSNAA